ncbi:hypothetical protein BS630_30730 [Rhizobium laguerreae]|nr:hypothetical protein BS630_30730 [Rhizobium laguerreae]
MRLKPARCPPSGHSARFPCPVIFGSNVTAAASNSAQGLHLVVSNIELAHAAIAPHPSAIRHDQ